MKLIGTLFFILMLGCSDEPAGGPNSPDTSDTGTIERSGIKQPGTQQYSSKPTAIGTEELTKTFEITGPRQFINAKSFKAKWTAPLNVKDYDIMLSLTTACNVGTLTAIPDYTLNEVNLGPLEEGEYYLCIQAIIEGGGLPWAENSPYKITVDLTKPDTFTIDQPISPTINTIPTITWTASTGSDSYEVTVARDSSCAIIDKIYEGLTDLTLTLDTLADGTYYICASASDLALNKTNASNNGVQLVIDTTPTAITTVSSSTTDGFYKAGDVISIDVDFNQTVSIDAGTDTPLLRLETGDTDSFASYVSGSGTTTLTFDYTIVAGDASVDLEVNAASPQIIYGDSTLRNAGGDIFVASGNEIGGNYLSASSALYVDTAAPIAVSNLTTSKVSIGSNVNYSKNVNIFFHWDLGSDANSGLSSYTLKRFDLADCAGTSTDTANLATSAIQQSFSGLDEKTYSFLIAAIDQASNTTDSACSGNITIDTTVPDTVATALITAADTPGGVDASYDSDGTVFFSWTAAADTANGTGIIYNTVHIFSGSACGGSESPETDQTGTSYSFTPTSDGIYSFKVTAFDFAGNSGTISACSSDIHIDTTAPAAVSALITPADSQGGVDAPYDDDDVAYFAWAVATDGGSGLDTYTLHRYDQANCGGTSSDTASIANSTTGQPIGSSVTGTTHSFKVTAYDLAGNSTVSACSTNIILDATDPIPPATVVVSADAAGGPSATEDNDTSIFFNWTAGSDPDSGIATYTLHRYDVADCGGGSPTDTASLTPATLNSAFASAVNGNTYSFNITVIDNVGNSVTSACSENNILIDTTAPTAATALATPADLSNGLDATYDDDVNIFFKWAAPSDGESGIDTNTFHRYDTSSCGGSATDTAGLANTVVDQTFAGVDGTTYSFKITSFDLAGNLIISACSSDITVDTSAPISAATALITSADVLADGENFDDDVNVFFEWTAGTDNAGGSGIEKYTVHIFTQTTCGGSSSNVTGPTSTNYTYGSAGEGIYSFKVTPIDFAGNTGTISGCSKDIQVDLTAPTQATSVETPADSSGAADAAVDNDSLIYVKWIAASDAETSIDYYKVRRYPLGSCAGTASDSTTTSTSSFYNSATNNSTYSFKIVSYDQAGNNSTSACSTDILIDMNPPTGFTITGPTNPGYDDTPNMTWADNGGADTWDIIIDDENSCSGGNNQSHSDEVTNSKTLSALADGTYYGCVTAKDNAGNTTVSSSDPYTFEIETTVLHVSFTKLVSGTTYSINYATLVSGTWTPAAIASGTDVIDDRSSLALDSNDKPHVSYSVNISSDNFLKYSNKISGSWSTVETVDNSTGDDYGFFSSLALNASNNIEINYSATDSGNTDDLLRNSAGTAGSFTPSTADSLTASGDVYRDISIAVDSGSPPLTHMISVESVSSTFGLRYQTDQDGWGVTTNHIPNNLPSCSHYMNASIALDSSKNPHISYSCVTAAGACKIYYATRAGGNWAHTEISTVKTSGCTFGSLLEKDRPSIAVDTATKVHITYTDQDNGHLKYRTNSSGSWTAEVTVDSGGSVDGEAAITLDDDNHVYIIYLLSTGVMKMATNNSGSFVIDATTISSDVTGIGTASATGVAGRSDR